MRHRLHQIPPCGVRLGHGDQMDGALGFGPGEILRRVRLIHQDHESIALRDNVSPPKIAGPAVGDHQNPVVAAFGTIEGLAERLDEFRVIGNRGGGLDGRRDHRGAAVRLQPSRDRFDDRGRRGAAGRQDPDHPRILRNVDRARLSQHLRHRPQHRRLQPRGFREHVGERVGGDSPHHTVAERSHAGRSGGTGDEAQISDRVAGGHLAEHFAVGSDGRESPGADHIDRIRRLPDPKKPFIGRDVLAINGTRELVELFILDLGK